jgi:hypothetical protein
MLVIGKCHVVNYWRIYNASILQRLVCDTLKKNFQQTYLVIQTERFLNDSYTNHLQMMSVWQAPQGGKSVAATTTHRNVNCDFLDLGHA